MSNAAAFEIRVDDKPVSYRDDMAIAHEAARYLKERHPKTDVRVRNLQDDTVSVIGWEAGRAFVES